MFAIKKRVLAVLPRTRWHHPNAEVEWYSYSYS